MDTSTLQTEKPIQKLWTFVLFYHVPAFEVKIFPVIPIRISLLVTSAVENSNIFVLNFEYVAMFHFTHESPRGRRLNTLNTKWFDRLQIHTHVWKFEKEGKSFHETNFIFGFLRLLKFSRCTQSGGNNKFNSRDC